jgi:hypothetical protein
MKLSKLIVHDGLKEIGFSAIEAINSLKEVRLPNSIEKIGNGNFRYCQNLKFNEYNGGLYLGNENNPYVALVKVINDEIQSFEINENTKIIINDTFKNCYNLKNITIPSNIVQIGERAFFNCKSLESIIIPESVKLINESAFALCSSLTNLTLSDSFVDICDSAFSSCTSLKEVIIHEGYVGDNAFESCSSLETLIISNKIKFIGDYSFADCTNLKNVTISKDLRMSDDSFLNCDNIEFNYF